jgi:Holliday junction resolvase RusA-like endonuclease
MIIALPFYVPIVRKTKGEKHFALNLNTFRNAHYTMMNSAKKAWVGIVKDAVAKCGGFWEESDPPYRFVYTAFPGTMRKFDLGNVLPACQKFTDDALIELGVIKDDNYKIVRAVDYRVGDVDPENPRIELEITRYED